MPTVNCRKLAVPPVVEKLAKPFSPSRIAVGLLIPLAGKQSAQVSCPLRIAGGCRKLSSGKYLPESPPAAGWQIPFICE